MKERFLVFIPAYNCEKQLPRVLDQLLDKQVAAFVTECIVVNNRSTDGTESAVRTWMTAHPDAPVRLLRNDCNYGLGGSHKVAFGYAVANGFDYLVVLHGDDQGDIRDLLPLLRRGDHRRYDCCLGSRFMKQSRIRGYSALRIVGNHGFNLLFSAVAGRRITDLGSGLNLYAVPPLRSGYYLRFPDTLYFNDCMILALCQLRQKLLFFPISWREEDQVSNNKLTSFGMSLLGLCGQYLKNKKEFVTREWREHPVDDYTYTVIASNL
ncbi:MAG: glycosyltransferase family 2 protein [Gemmiger sp.]|uniref:glycosyltransferase family 2 protein n=1 Tax=Gemmiger sp. TaxID=2049027 RepID=UPI002E77BAB4|nr:glycosyltransferase family 2 protein [Gemmiger sp.]MEE0801536.1 glycosyltransferase family 2 protein [Gemmiger sp.]